MNKTSIDWKNPKEGWSLTHTLNPVVGCKRQPPCFYCYARTLHNKRHSAYMAGKKVPDAYAKHFGEMQFFPERLGIPKKSKVIKCVFVGSMTDICFWEKLWMRMVLNTVEFHPEIVFMFLTKDPSVYTHFNFPQNCWLGVTITGAEDFDKQFELSRSLQKNIPNKLFVSVEPLLGYILYDFRGRGIDLVIVGADSRKNGIAPKREWIESIQHPNIHYKKNIIKYLNRENLPIERNNTDSQNCESADSD